MDDYASEKLFDPFASPLVPIYWGPNNTDIFLPAENSLINVRHHEFGPDGQPDMDAIAGMFSRLSMPFQPPKHSSHAATWTTASSCYAGLRIVFAGR